MLESELRVSAFVLRYGNSSFSRALSGSGNNELIKIKVMKNGGCLWETLSYMNFQSQEIVRLGAMRLLALSLLVDSLLTFFPSKTGSCLFFFFFLRFAESGSSYLGEISFCPSSPGGQL